MKNFAIWLVVLLAIVENAFSNEPKQPPKELTVPLGGGASLELVLIPAGSFVMGDDNDSYGRPAHKVTITKPFYLSKYLITQEQWQVVTGGNPSRPKVPKSPLPAVRVSWEDCQQFLSKLNRRRGSQAGKFVLPTEAQWEYACRAGSTTKYSFGDDVSKLGEYAWYRDNSGNKAHPVGEKKPNAWGLYDMHGNVWEWCADWSGGDYYANSPVNDPAGPTRGSKRVARGGGWSDYATGCWSACRGNSAPGDSNDSMGFRVARLLAK